MQQAQQKKTPDEDDKKNSLREGIIISEEKKEIKDRCKNCRLLEKRQVKRIVIILKK